MLHLKKHIEKPEFHAISKAAEKTGLSVYLIGGYVRDLIMGGKSNDIDIVVEGSGTEFAKTLEKSRGFSLLNIYENFGTAMLRYKDLNIEFVGARKESYRKTSRKPIVENGSLQDDQLRRDFTINAMALSLNKADFGALTDPFNGLSDLERKIIRTPLESHKTFSDDPLRMLRAIRFATQLGFKIEGNCYAAISDNAERLEIVSMERISDELNKIMLADQPSRGILMLEDTGILEMILPELTALKGVETVNNTAHKDNFLHSVKVLDNIADHTENLWLRWAALLHDIGKYPTKKFQNTQWTFHAHDYVGSKMLATVFRRLKFPLNEKMKYVQKMLRLHMRPKSLVEDVVSDSALRRLLYEAGDDIDDLMLLCESDITSRNLGKKKLYKDNFKHVHQKLCEIEEKDRIRNFEPPIKGEEIMKRFDLPPCKEVGIIKQAIKDAILDGIIPNEYEAANEYMYHIAEKMGIPKK